MTKNWLCPLKGPFFYQISYWPKLGSISLPRSLGCQEHFLFNLSIQWAEGTSENWHAKLCYATLCYAILCYATLRYAMIRHVMLCYAMLCYAILCYVMLRYAVLLPTWITEPVPERAHLLWRWRGRVLLRNVGVRLPVVSPQMFSIWKPTSVKNSKLKLTDHIPKINVNKLGLRFSQRWL
jgi:hypothetical protein